MVIKHGAVAPLLSLLSVPDLSVFNVSLLNPISLLSWPLRGAINQTFMLLLFTDWLCKECDMDTVEPLPQQEPVPPDERNPTDLTGSHSSAAPR